MDERPAATPAEAAAAAWPTSTDPRLFTFGGRRLAPAAVTEILAPYVSPRRRARIEAALDGRTYRLAPVIEGLVNYGNAAAVMRTAEAFGCQAFHIVADATDLKTSKRTTQGAEKWLDVRTWESPAACASHLRGAGFRIVVTHLEAAVPLAAIDFARPTALVFGNERRGVSDAMLAEADRRVVIPTTGLTRSLNISVAAAIALHHAVRARGGRHGDLTDAERERLRAMFYLRSVREVEALIGEVLRRRGPGGSGPAPGDTPSSP